MTRTTNARLAGAAFLLYIGVGISQMVLSGSIPDAEGTAAKLASMAAHANLERIDMLLGMFTGFIALTLGVALYGVTRDEDHEIALLALLCRVGEGLSIMFPMFATMGLLWLATGDAVSMDPAGAYALAGFLMKVGGWNMSIAATFFAVASTLFCWLLLRGRMIPAALAWLGLFASVLLVIALPLRMTELLSSKIMMLLWLPMAAFEIPLGFWLLIKGVPVAGQNSSGQPV